MKKPKVLIVDDEASIRSILSALLNKNGYKVEVADSGEAALQVYAQFMPAVILLDLKMGGIDGIKVMEKLDKQFKTDCKVIIMTAHGEVRSAVEAMKKGAFDYLQKPFDNDELLAIISRAVACCDGFGIRWGGKRSRKPSGKALTRTRYFCRRCRRNRRGCCCCRISPQRERRTSTRIRPAPLSGWTFRRKRRRLSRRSSRALRWS